MDKTSRREVNARNARKSTGPRTAAGKSRSSMNALRHGILTRRMLLPGEDAKELFELTSEMRASLAPRGGVEDELVEKMIAAVWRRRRADAVESGLWDWRGRVSSKQMTLAGVFLEDSVDGHSIEKICRYMSGCDREFYRALTTLRALQKERAELEENLDGSDGSATAEGGSPDDDSQPTEVSPPDVDVEGRPSLDNGMVESQGSVAQGYNDDPTGEDDPGDRDTQGFSPDAAAGLVRTWAQKMSADQIVAAVMADPARLERLSAGELIRLRASLDRSMWEDTQKLDEMIDRMSVEGGSDTAPQTPAVPPDQIGETNPVDEEG